MHLNYDFFRMITSKGEGKHHEETGMSSYRTQNSKTCVTSALDPRGRFRASRSQMVDKSEYLKFVFLFTPKCYILKPKASL